MFNLLPDNLKEEIKKEYKLRFLAVILLFVLFVQISFLVFSFPLWLVSSYKEKEVVLRTEKMNESPLNLKIKPVLSNVKSINTKLNILGSLLEYPKVIPIVDVILSKKTKAIRINQLSYTSTAKTKGSVILGGISSTREDLVSFVKSLQGSGSFANVDLPISNFAREKDINFTINLTVVQ